jgi:hypothetical protein
VDDVLDNTTDVTVLLGEVEGTEPGRVLAVVGVGLEDPTRLSLVTNNALNPSSIPLSLSFACDLHPFLLLSATDTRMNTTTHCLDDTRP